MGWQIGRRAALHQTKAGTQETSWSGFQTIQPSFSAAPPGRLAPVFDSASSSTSCTPRWRTRTWSWGCCGRRSGWRRRRRGRGWRTEGESGWQGTCSARPPGSQSWFWKRGDLGKIFGEVQQLADRLVTGGGFCTIPVAAPETRPRLYTLVCFANNKSWDFSSSQTKCNLSIKEGIKWSMLFDCF